MKDFNDSIYKILTKAEAQGTLGASVTANQIFELAKARYKSASEEEKKQIIYKLEALEKEPGVKFQEHFQSSLES